MTIDTLGSWHRIVAAKDAAGLDELLAARVVFHSPIVHTPQAGKEVTTLYLTAALRVLGTPGFRYVREILGERDAVLEFTTEVDGVSVNGVDLIRWDDAGQIVDFKVMLRPLKAVNLIHQKMAQLLAPKAQ